MNKLQNTVAMWMLILLCIMQTASVGSSIRALEPAKGTEKESVGNAKLTKQLFLAKDLTTMRQLIFSGANVNGRSTNGVTPLIMETAPGRSDDLSAYLLSKGAIVDLRDHDGETPLMWASQAGRSTLVRILLDHHANINARANDGSTALLEASEYSSIHDTQCAKVVSLLLAMGANINAHDNNGNTAIFNAVETSASSATVEALAAGGADVNETHKMDQAGTKMSLLMCSMFDETAKTTEVLLTHHANVDWQRPDNGQTALIAAINLVQPKFVKLLIDHGANTEIKDLDGNTALDYARNNGSQDIESLLEQRPTH
jgi:ankyrin repeat protein